MQPPNWYLYQGREKKGHEGVKGSPVELYQGTIISDHEATFQNYETRHQECLVHVERYVRSSIENEPPSDYFRDGHNLYKRMSADKEDYLLFLHDPSVAPTNNLAERCGRKFKRKVAQVMCFRSMEGVNYFCDGLSVVQTLKSNDENLYHAVTSRFNKREEARC